jgi:hypothetical protein
VVRTSILQSGRKDHNKCSFEERNNLSFEVAMKRMTVEARIIGADPLETAHRAWECLMQRNRNSVATDISSYRSATGEKLDLAPRARWPRGAWAKIRGSNVLLVVRTSPLKNGFD